jgi:hypothetical protein
MRTREIRQIAARGSFALLVVSHPGAHGPAGRKKRIFPRLDPVFDPGRREDGAKIGQTALAHLLLGRRLPV